ncbi:MULTISPECIES: ACP S-malonyltransferase [Gordonia]|uniref:[acyl-carrier-protein] S-malonyltransferase n=1 Tax=Gordonia sputi NBRC 100414 TaxID=1089453 RepID=H5U1E6_9ACTN|nr:MULTISPECIES: ACP S-malonyltransferase [Gordonia]MCM3895451.1 ACP S-malonyltransferase [Gordonia sputi]NKY94404.1 ACP S-malonyltransferase [Gordonia sputi]GAB39554.1 malonyl-CoA--acyl carrier protein transacylase [Gordonia sputi NBRC 100414]
MLSLLAPGQGSQTPGMLAPWLELPGARDQLAIWSKLAGLDLERLGTTATADEITDTAVTQPLVVASALLAFNEYAKNHELPDDAVVAGHSVGELTAAAITGVITFDEAVTLAAVRGAQMAKACSLQPTTMAAVLGGDEQEVLARLDELDLVPANRNAVGQIVAAGDVAAIDELIANPPEKARTRKLAVAGAFHTRFMEPARDAVAQAAASITPSDPTRTLLSNSDGQPVTTGTEALSKLVEQVTSPVRWDLCSAYMRDAGTDSIIELTPAGTLVGIAKRELKGVGSVALKVPADIEKI